MNEKKKISVIGPKHIVAIFSPVGLQTHFAEDSSLALSKAKELIKEKNQAIILIYQDFFDEISSEEYDKLTANSLPAIMALPGLNPKDEKQSFQKLRKIAEKAVGIDILKN